MESSVWFGMRKEKWINLVMVIFHPSSLTSVVYGVGIGRFILVDEGLYYGRGNKSTIWRTCQSDAGGVGISMNFQSTAFVDRHRAVGIILWVRPLHHGCMRVVDRRIVEKLRPRRIGRVIVPRKDRPYYARVPSFQDCAEPLRITESTVINPRPMVWVGEWWTQSFPDGSIGSPVQSIMNKNYDALGSCRCLVQLRFQPSQLIFMQIGIGPFFVRVWRKIQMLPRDSVLRKISIQRQEPHARETNGMPCP